MRRTTRSERRATNGLAAALWLLCLAPATLAPSAFGQVNTEKLRIAEDAEGLGATVAANALFRTGNVEVLDLGLRGRLDLRRGNLASFLIGNVTFSEAEDRVFLDESFVHLRTVLRLPGLEWVRPEAFVQTQRDDSQLLTRRYLAGAGLRLQLYQDSTAAAFFGTTPMVEYELLDRGEVLVDPETTVGRWSNYLVLKLELTDLVTFAGTAYVQPRFDRFRDVRVLGEAGLNVQLTRALALRATLNLRYDSEPPADLDRFDLALRNGLAVTF
ncbi:MAG: DUF481 domain-containing protein [Bacteroidota bacterium]